MCKPMDFFLRMIVEAWLAKRLQIHKKIPLRVEVR